MTSNQEVWKSTGEKESSNRRANGLSYELSEEGWLLALLTEEGYTHLRKVPGRGWCGLLRYLYTSGLVCGLTPVGYVARYCYADPKEALAALDAWDGTGDPSGPWLVFKSPGAERVGPGMLDEQELSTSASV